MLLSCKATLITYKATLMTHVCISTDAGGFYLTGGLQTVRRRVRSDTVGIMKECTVLRGKRKRFTDLMGGIR